MPSTYLPLARSEQQQRREAAGRTDQVDGRRTGEVLHAEVGLQPSATEDPVRADRVDQRGEDDRVDDVDAELDALQRGAPDDRQRDRAEGELEEPLRLDRGVGEAQTVGKNAVCGSAEVAQEESGVADDLARTEREGEADGPVTNRGDREVDEDLRDDRAGVLSAREADLQERESGLHEDHEDGRDDHTHMLLMPTLSVSDSDTTARCCVRRGKARGRQDERLQRREPKANSEYFLFHVSLHAPFGNSRSSPGCIPAIAGGWFGDCTIKVCSRAFRLLYRWRNIV